MKYFKNLELRFMFLKYARPSFLFLTHYTTKGTVLKYENTKEINPESKV